MDTPERPPEKQQDSSVVWDKRSAISPAKKKKKIKRWWHGVIQLHQCLRLQKLVMCKTPREGLNSENHTALQSSCLIKSPFNFLTAKVKRHWASSVTDTTTNEDRQYVTSSAALKSVPVGPHVGITEVPSAYHVPLFPGTPLPCCVFIHLSFKVVPRVTILSARPTRTVNIKRHGTVPTKRWVRAKLLWRRTWQCGWRSPGLPWHSSTGMDLTILR